jgi:hypothetical protein
MTTEQTTLLARVAAVPAGYLPRSQAERNECVKLFNARRVSIILQKGRPDLFRALAAPAAEGRT